MQHSNRLIHETSPYLLQHAHNPVDWYPWGAAAFAKARREDKPVFLSIGYSTCHWCHVMARECFEQADVAARLNRDFISVKVDREERPDIDGVYLRACEAMTGSGGWPMSILMTAEGKPFFIGTYLPKKTFLSLLDAVTRAWRHNRAPLLQSGEAVASALAEAAGQRDAPGAAPLADALAAFRGSFDPEYGGFGTAPKFPSPHNLMFLLYTAPELAERTLVQLYRGGIFDQIGGGFSRYSTDRFWLIPHFEKMLYDNAMLAMTYLLAFEATGKALYRQVADRIFGYLERDLRAPGGGFFSAQDADSGGVEGAFYLFTPDELTALLGDADGARFCRFYGIRREGNFEGKSVPNLLHQPEPDPAVSALLPRVYAYRKERMPLATDRNLLTGWNALTAAAYAMAARILQEGRYLQTARATVDWIERDLTEDCTVFSGTAGGARSGPGFLDDYAFYLFALLQLHQATLEDRYFLRAEALAKAVWEQFRDEKDGGFFFSGPKNEALLSRPKEVWDGAVPSGNSVMAYVLFRLALLTENEQIAEWAEKQARFMNGAAAAYPPGCGFYLYASLPVKKIVCALRDPSERAGLRVRSDWAFRLAEGPEYPLKNGRTTYYVCENGACLPPSNSLSPHPPHRAGA